MAYINQAEKKEIAADLKKVFGTAKKRGFKYTLTINNYSTLIMNISAGKVDFLGSYKGANHDNYIQVHNSSHDLFEGEAKEIIEKAFTCLNKGNWDESDIMTDYFNVGWYVYINIGKWDKPYKLER